MNRLSRIAGHRGPGSVLILVGAICAVAMPAFADRHCSFARQSAFYAREISAEALASPPDQCPAKLSEARERLDDTMAELEICSCAPAEAPLKKWLDENRKNTAAGLTACRAGSRAINAIARNVLIQVEKCF